MSSFDELQSILSKFSDLAAGASPEQQATMLRIFQSAYHNVASTIEASKNETYDEESVDDEVHDEEYYDDEQEEAEYEHAEAVEPVQSDRVHPEQLAQLKEIFLFIVEKMYQMGRASMDLFARYDVTAADAISVIDFKHALSTINVYLLKEEMAIVYRLFGTELEFDDENGVIKAIKYRSFIQYLEALRSKSVRSIQSDTYASLMTKRANALQQTAVDDDLERKNVKQPLKARLLLAKKVLREHLYSRSVTLPQLFKIVNNPVDGLSLKAFANSLPSYGFPTNTCSVDEVISVLLREPALKPGFLAYSEMCAFIQDTTPEVIEKVTPKHILQDKSVVDVLVKLNSLPLRPRFKQIDEDNDGLVSVDAVIDDLCALGLHQDTAANPALGDFISTFSTKADGQITYAEFVQFINSRVGNVSQPAVMVVQTIEVDENASPADLVLLVNRTIKNGVSLESIFAGLADHNSQRIDEADLWHALTAIGFNVSKDLSGALFDMLGPELYDEEDEYPTLDYHEVAITFIHPQRNPRVGVSNRARGTGGDDNVPLGSGVDRLNHEFVKNTISNKKKETSSKKFNHSHKFDNQDVEDRDEEFESEYLKRSGKFSKNGSSTVNLQDLQPGEVVEQSGFGAKKRGGFEAVANSSIDFEQDHGGVVQRQASKSSQLARKPTIKLGMNDMDPVLANKQDHYTNSDVFNVRESHAPQQRRLLRAGDTKHTKSNVSFNQEDNEEYAPIKTRICPPGGRSKIQISHQEDSDIQSNITGCRRRVVSTKPSDSIMLDYDEKRATKDAAELTLGQHSRKHFTVGGSMESSSMSVTSRDLPLRRTTSKRTQSTLTMESSIDSQQDTALIKQFDSMVLEEPVHYEAEDDYTSLRVALGKEVYARGKVKKVFSDWSKGNSNMTRSQLIEGARSVYIDLDNSTADSLIRSFDKDNKGSITFGEFVRILSTSEAN